MRKSPAVYILASRLRGTLYVGVTGNLQRRIYLHRSRSLPGFTSRYNVTRLVYFELFDDFYSAICREKQLKGGSRQKKVSLIEAVNPDWQDLYDQVYDW